MEAKLKEPRSQLAEVLYGLITENEISERMFDQNGFRSRLTNLRKMGLNIRDKWKSFVSKHGHPGQYKSHYLWQIEKKKAQKLYEKINK